MSVSNYVLYQFELQLVGVILLSAMAAGGLSLWIKRRKTQQDLDQNKLSDGI